MAKKKVKRVKRILRGAKKTSSAKKTGGGKIFVLGDGAWGTALAIVLAGNGHDVAVWGAFPEYTKKLARRGENFKFLPGVAIPKEIAFTNDLSALADSGCGLMVMAAPTQFARGVHERAVEYVRPGLPVVSVAKDISKKSADDIKSRLAEMDVKARVNRKGGSGRRKRR